MRTSFPDSDTVNGTRPASACTSSKRRPMKRLIEYTVFSGLVIIWFFAGWPMRRSSLSGEGDDGGRGPLSFRVLDDDWLAALHDRDAGVCRAEVDPYDLAHRVISLFRRFIG